MSAGDLLFAVCAVACLAGAITTISSQNPIRGAMGLLATIIGIVLVALIMVLAMFVLVAAAASS